MPSQAPSSDPTRFLVFVLNLNNSGHVALDRWGVLSQQFGVFDLHHFRSPERRVRALLGRVGRALRAVRPALVVLGISSSAGPTQGALIKRVRERLRRAHIRCVTRPVERARELFLDDLRVQRHGELSAQLTDAFVPELACRVVSGGERHREREVYWRRAWHALALGLHEFAERHPRHAFALSRRAPNRYYQLIAKAEKRRRSRRI